MDVAVKWGKSKIKFIMNRSKELKSLLILDIMIVYKCKSLKESLGQIRVLAKLQATSSMQKKKNPASISIINEKLKLKLKSI